MESKKLILSLSIAFFDRNQGCSFLLLFLLHLFLKPFETFNRAAIISFRMRCRFRSRTKHKHKRSRTHARKQAHARTIVEGGEETTIFSFFLLLTNKLDIRYTRKQNWKTSNRARVSLVFLFLFLLSASTHTFLLLLCFLFPLS